MYRDVSKIATRADTTNRAISGQGGRVNRRVKPTCIFSGETGNVRVTFLRRSVMRAHQVLRTTCLMLACAVVAAAHKESPWVEVRSPHFLVLTNGSEGSARRIAKEFEQVRSVFARGFPNMRLESGSPMLIFAPRDEVSMKHLVPIMWKKRPPNVAGYFDHGWERQFAVVRLDQDIPGAYQVVYHEYTHTLLSANTHWLPMWLNEGLADYYGGTRFEGAKVYVG